MDYEDIARVCHEANRALCKAFGDHSQVPWDEADDGIKASAIDGVQRIQRRPLTTPADLHESWCQFKVNDGWVYGPIKDPIRKTHPCLVPYSQLPVEQKDKDYIFGEVTRLLLPYLRPF